MNVTGIQYRVSLKESTGHVGHFPVVTVAASGISTDYCFTADFFNSADYRTLSQIGAELKGLMNKDAYVQRGERKQIVSNFKEVLNWLMEEAKRGQAIQRYKGLGEMNPDQLWETTMNPETRRMLQVKIEDAVLADQIFTTLMGDQVDPRRAFIEDNALAAINIDV